MAMRFQRPPQQQQAPQPPQQPQAQGGVMPTGGPPIPPQQPLRKLTGGGERAPRPIAPPPQMPPQAPPMMPPQMTQQGAPQQGMGGNEKLRQMNLVRKQPTPEEIAFQQQQMMARQQGF